MQNFIIAPDSGQSNKAGEGHAIYYLDVSPPLKLGTPATTAPGVHLELAVHWATLLTLMPLACIMTSSLGLALGTRISPRNISVMFGFIVLPMTFLGGTYYPWTALSAVQIAGFPWLQALVCLNPLIYITEGFRAALTTTPHMPEYVIYPVLTGFCALLLWAGIKGFYERVLS